MALYALLLIGLDVECIDIHLGLCVIYYMQEIIIAEDNGNGGIDSSSASTHC